MEYIKQAYQEILEVVSKHKELAKNSDFRDIEEMIRKAKNHLFIVDWNEKYNLNIQHDKQISGYDFLRIDDYRYFSYFKDAKDEKEKGYGRYISWEDGNKQPNNEWLLCISFSTGAYIFGDDYPEKLFEKFWQELKSYNPDYCDSHNHSMYFSLEKASKVFNEFNAIKSKYHEINKTDSKERKIKKLQDELEKLKS